MRPRYASSPTLRNAPEEELDVLPRGTHHPPAGRLGRRITRYARCEVTVEPATRQTRTLGAGARRSLSTRPSPSPSSPLRLRCSLLAAMRADTRSSTLGVLLAALASLPLVARRRAPLAVFVTHRAASAALNGLGYPPGPPLGPTIALYFLALSPRRTRAPRWVDGRRRGRPLRHPRLRRRHRRGRVPDRAAPLRGPRLGRRLGPRRPRAPAAGADRRARGAGRRAEREAERERRLAAAEERTRIARDLHDSAGHAINVILVQAGAARLLQRARPGALAAPRSRRSRRSRARRSARSTSSSARCARTAPSRADVEPPPASRRWTRWSSAIARPASR